MNGYTKPQDDSILTVDEKTKLHENRKKNKRALEIIDKRWTILLLEGLNQPLQPRKHGTF
jgi:DNA-binding HxlR family transcriptional regulator